MKLLLLPMLLLSLNASALQPDTLSKKKEALLADMITNADRTDSLYWEGLKDIRHDCFVTFRFRRYFELNREIKKGGHK